MRETPEQEMIVVIDDDYAIRLSCQKILTKAGFQVETFEDGSQGLEGVARLKPSLVVVDLKMPGISGMEVIARVHEIVPQAIIVVITGYATIGTAVEAMKVGAYDFLPKPFSPDELRVIVNRGLERRRLALESERSEVERALLKRRFITFVSHQLQTPLVAVHQCLDVLKQLGGAEGTEAKRQEWINRCLSRTEEMLAIIKDWLALAKVEADSLSRRRVSVDLRRVVSDILRAYEEMAGRESITLEARLPEEPCLVKGDRTCMGVLFDNLIVNAIKYNKAGGKVTVSAEEVDGEVVAAVTDTGIGIAEKHRPFLFEEFYRIKDESGKRTTGTGLGLPICKKIVTELGGKIEVESELEAGSTFRVRLPASREQEEADSSGSLE